MTTEARASLLEELSPLFEAWTGPFTKQDLLDWLEGDLGKANALEELQRYGSVQSLACAPESILHVLSQNTPHAAFQTLLRGLLLGSHNSLKLPRVGIPELSRVLEQLPPALGKQIDVFHELPADWKERFDVIVVFGREETTDWFRQETPSNKKLLLHGPKLSIALVTGAVETAAEKAARDISQFDQQGCLSVHNVYLHSDSNTALVDFAALLTEQMDRFNIHTPRSALPDSAAGAITALREAVRYESSTRPDSLRLWESEGGTDWTVVMDDDPAIAVSPLNRVVYVKPWPQEVVELGKERQHLATLALHPFSEQSAPTYRNVGATRICPLGQTQDPPLFWHHDGLSPLGSLVTWLDIEPSA